MDPSLCFSPDAITPTSIYESSTPLRMAEEHQATISIHEGALEFESECLNVLTTEISTPIVITNVGDKSTCHEVFSRLLVK